MANSELELANALGEAGQYCGAELIWKDHVRLNPGDAFTLFNIGLMIEAQADTPARRVEALSYYERVALADGVPMPLRSDAMNNFGVLMHRIGRTDKGCIALNLALQMDPENPTAQKNFAEALRQVGKFEESDAEYEKVVRYSPNDAGAHFSRGMVALLLGDLERGWREYEWRFKVPDFPTRPFESVKPLWQGEDLSGKTICLTQEQGFGDAIQFIRYAREIENRWPTCRIYFYGHALLSRLFADAIGVGSTFHEADENGAMLRDGKEYHYDFHCPLLSLPLRFGTTLENIPAQMPYIWPRTSVSDDLRDVLDGIDDEQAVGQKCVGLVWAGSPRHGRDRWRSLPPESFQPIVDAHPECRFFALQVGPRQPEAAKLNGVTDLGLLLAGEGWEGTAEVLRRLDLLISVDTGTAHLAGALGVPTWLLTPYSPDWRWMLNREDTPWYPCHHLFRQPSGDDWETPIQRINEALGAV